jgi:hypothetical protein
MPPANRKDSGDVIAHALAQTHYVFHRDVDPDAVNSRTLLLDRLEQFEAHSR